MVAFTNPAPSPWNIVRYRISNITNIPLFKYDLVEDTSCGYWCNFIGDSTNIFGRNSNDLHQLLPGLLLEFSITAIQSIHHTTVWLYKVILHMRVHIAIAPFNVQ